MSEYPELGAKESECWDVVLEPLLQRVADIQSKVTLMHSDPDFIHSDASEYLDLKKSLKWAENYLFQAKQARAYVIRFKAKERNDDAPDKKEAGQGIAHSLVRTTYVASLGHQQPAGTGWTRVPPPGDPGNTLRASPDYLRPARR